MTLFCFEIVDPCRIRMINVCVRRVSSEMSVKLIYISRKVGIFIYLLLMCSSIKALIVKIVRRMTYFAGMFMFTTELC
jgi:hypothetical protein